LSPSQKIKIPEDQLVALLKAKDEKAFGILYDNYSAALYGVISRIVADDEIAQDVMQDAFVKIWKNIGAYDTSKGRLFTWIVNVARNAAIDEIRSLSFRKQGQNQSLDAAVNRSVQGKNSTHKEDHIGLKETVSGLKPEYRVIIDLLYFKGYTQEEASKELNLPLGTVKTRTRAALIQLREIFNITTA
jgi:RNA polymerase sigma-70 factor (ECF subfamily)